MSKGTRRRRRRAPRAGVPRRGRWKAAILLLAGAAVAGAGWLIYRNGGAEPPSDPPARLTLTPVSTSPYRNTGAGVQFVGSAACRECHEDEHASYCATGMGRSLGEVDIDAEPPDGAFDHPLSRRRYEVYRRDGKLWHRELLALPGGGHVVLNDYPMRYVVGSGNHSRSYLVDFDGFLVESPVTWYASRQAWGMSPGFDAPLHKGFERATPEECLICHAGRLQVLDKSVHRIKFVEEAIGCERCHGPGSLHVAVHRGQREAAAGDADGEIDHTIVNPADLSRELSEAVCQQCHLRGTAVTPAPGRAVADFRPGLPLQDFRHDYFLEPPESSMTVVGHVEQMHLSRCYRESQTLTCLTCHNPHDEPAAADRAAHYRAICLNCHGEQQCTASAESRAQTSPANDCVACHMPRSATDIPHFAFTHHRIGLHGAAARDETASGDAAGQSDVAPALRPFLDLSRYSEPERQFSLALGYLDIDAPPGSPAAARYYDRALRLLQSVGDQGPGHGVLDAALARVHFELGLDGVQQYAERALADATLAGQDRCNALFLLAEVYGSQNRPRESARLLEELTTLRRESIDWLALADRYAALGDEPARIKALATAVQINPRLFAAHRMLADYYRGRGDEQRAKFHQQRAIK